MRIVKRHEVIQPQDHSIKLVPLTRGLDAIVDADDFVASCKQSFADMHADESGATGYKYFHCGGLSGFA